MQVHSKYASNEYPSVTCHICGVEQIAKFIEPTKTLMAELRLCFTCLFWTEVIKDKANKTIIGGTCYQIGPEPKIGESDKFLGFAGRRHLIKYNDGRQVDTRNLWHNGVIPPQFTEQLPNNAIFEKVF